MPPFIKSFAADESGFELVLKGGHRIRYTYEEPKQPSLPPPTFDTTAEPIEPSRPGLAKCARVIQLPLSRRRSA